MRTSRALALVVGAALTACASTGRPTAAEDRARIVARIDQFHDAIREGDPGKYADVFVDDFLFTWSRNGQLYDRAAILPNVVPTPDFAPLVDEVLVRQRGDAAAASFRVRKPEDEPGVRVTFAYARVAGAWKVLASHSTAIVPPEPEGSGEE